MDIEKIIQSYVKEKFFVSTILRDDSSDECYPSRFYETIAWEWDKETRKRGNCIAEACGNLDDHIRICRELLMMEGEE